MVVSNPLGYEGSITTGVVSGLRPQGVQLDAAIGPGSSGAPVLDRMGDVIGVVKGQNPNAQNLNYAVPVALVRRLRAYSFGSVIPPTTFAETTRRSRTRALVECAALSDLVNRSIFEIQQLTTGSTQPDLNIRRMQDMARLYDQLGNRVRALPLVSDVVKYGRDYQTMCAKMATLARRFAVALEAKDEEKAQAAANDFDAIERQEDTLVDAINTFCTQ